MVAAPPGLVSGPEVGWKALCQEERVAGVMAVVYVQLDYRAEHDWSSSGESEGDRSALVET